MAELIPNNFILISGRYLIKEDSPGSCIGTIIQVPTITWGSLVSTFELRRNIPNPAFDPENPVEPPAITVTYNKVIFNKNAVQEVMIGDTDYFLIHSDDILAFIEPE